MATTSASLLSALNAAPHAFLQPSLPLYTDTIAYLKNALDPLAKEVSTAQQERLDDHRKKRKRGQLAADGDVLRLKQIHTDGFGIEQVWEQARRVIEAARKEAVQGLNEIESRRKLAQSNAGLSGSVEVSERKDLHNDEDDLILDASDEASVDGELEGPDKELEEDIKTEQSDKDGFESEAPEEFVADKFGLNDGFFSIDDFNRQSEFLEQQDMRGDHDGAASDEEDVDWDADPTGQSNVIDASIGVNEDSEDEEEDGPTFGDPDALSIDDDGDIEAGELDDMGVASNTNNIMYADFFAPPAQKKKKKKGRPNPHNFPKATKPEGEEEDDDDDMQRTIDAVHRDLFEDEDSEHDSDEDRNKLNPGDPMSRRSAHERRKAALAEQIRKLEAANVAAREWTLSGEARANDRPLNSLLEEDLDFERTGKPVPVITAEISESIEDLIKRRILDHDFQDIIRRRPDDLATGKDARRGRLDFHLDDEKSKKGLAEEYEEDHLRRTDSAFVDVKDEKMKKEEAEIEALWKKICSDLDNLSSWHFRPKRPVQQLDIRVDAPAITMEDARPSGPGDVAGASRLAPQEVYKAGEGARGVREEVVGKSGLPTGRAELSRDEKKRRRRREKERIKKTGLNPHKGEKSRRETKDSEMLNSLKQGGVKVIGKKGELQDLQGREVQSSSNGGPAGASRYKL